MLLSSWLSTAFSTSYLILLRYHSHRFIYDAIDLGRFQCWWDHVRIFHLGDRNLSTRFPVALGRVDMQLVGYICRLVLRLIFISEMGAHRYPRHESLSVF